MFKIQPVQKINPTPDLETETTLVTPTKKKWLPSLSKKTKIILIASCSLLLLIVAGLTAVGAYTYQTALTFKSQVDELKVQGQAAYDQFKGQNLPGAEQQLTDLNNNFGNLEATYAKLNFYGKVPVVNKYYQDGQAGLTAAKEGLAAGLVAIKALTPYADVLGFQGEGTFTGGTAENRIKLLLETLDKVSPQFDQIQSHLSAVQTALNEINPDDYPETVKETVIRSQIVKLKEMANQTIDGFADFRPVIEQLPALAGGKGDRKKYLILFQNDNELRPTGGFLTAYAVVFVEDGKISPEKSDDIYELDKKFTQKITIPESLGRYLITEKYWHLRDMNISPDFKVSMDQFFTNYQKVKGEPQDVDGIIAVDTHVLTKLLEILGPVEIPGYGTFSAENDARCDCPQVVYALSEIITRPTPYLRDDRKGVLGPLMQAILSKTYGAPKQKWADLFNLAWTDIKGRHIQMYFMENSFQQAAETVGAAGRLPAPVANQDFLAIIDANLGGAKSNLFTEYQVNQSISGPTDQKIEKTVEITYKNTRKADNCNLEAGLLCLNSTLQDWHRLYLPAGSSLVSAQGFTTEPKAYEENGFQVIDGFFKLEPNGVAKVKITYQVPYQADQYRLTIWKQGGIDQYQTLIDVNGNQTELKVDQDQTFESAF